MLSYFFLRKTSDPRERKGKDREREDRKNSEESVTHPNYIEDLEAKTVKKSYSNFITNLKN